MVSFAARRREQLILRRTRAALGVQLVCRAIAMFSACSPGRDDADACLFFGQSDAALIYPQMREVRLIGGEADCDGTANAE